MCSWSAVSWCWGIYMEIICYSNIYWILLLLRSFSQRIYPTRQQHNLILFGQCFCSIGRFVHGVMFDGDNLLFKHQGNTEILSRLQPTDFTRPPTTIVQYSSNIRRFVHGVAFLGVEVLLWRYSAITSMEYFCYLVSAIWFVQLINSIVLFCVISVFVVLEDLFMVWHFLVLRYFYGDILLFEHLWNTIITERFLPTDLCNSSTI